ncbi:hypoxanthine phosphoribosyltransferase [Phycisphaerales bacterium AB-hyl4]|uniref:Hypoxanthine phosphoribosyltransferase n=1 Tax=Natronomicrosphaera hydrolytica TaxID=3242702 RepID=A0ABV4U3P8_9BACT
MERDIDRVLIDRNAIAQRVNELAAEIADELAAEADADAATPLEVTLVPILTGSFMFVADLMRCLPMRMQIHMMSITSYPGRSTASRGASVVAGLTRLPESLAGLHVLLIDDILDSGQTLQLATQTLRDRNPASLRTCVLLRKQREDAMHTPVDYVAFDIPDEFVVGYGLDFDDYYRNLPDIVTLKREVVEA